MGLFSSKRYTKEGKGVEKNAPEKNSFFKFFELFSRSFNKLVIGNLLYVLVSLPVLTVGLAEAGLTYICRAAARNQHTFAVSDFFETIKKNWKQALISGIFDTVIYAILAYDIFYAYNAMMELGGFFNQCYFGLTILMMIIYRFSSYYRSTIIITFKMKITQIYKDSFIFALSALGPNMIIIVSLFACLLIGFLLVWFLGYLGGAIALIAYILIYPAFSCYLKQYCIFPSVKKFMIDPYYEKHPDEDIVLRRRLGLLPAEEDDFDYSSLKTEE
jgi:uncharacterized membrane protein YesL